MHADVCSILHYNVMLAAGQQKPIWSPTWNCDLHCSGAPAVWVIPGESFYSWLQEWNVYITIYTGIINDY